MRWKISVAFTVITMINAASSEPSIAGQTSAAVLPADHGAIDLPVRKDSPPCGGDQWFPFYGEISVRNIDRPNLLPVLTAQKSTPVPAVVVAPGGGFTGLRYDGEGLAVAKRFADAGISAFVLKYRVKCTARSTEAFLAGQKNRKKQTDFPQYRPALEDAQTALAYIRQHASEFGVDAKRIGIIGFSAGAITTLSAAQSQNVPEAPDFAMAIYPQMNSPLHVPANPVPLFIAIAGDDSLFGNQGFSIVEKWKKQKGSVELHYFEAGEHGFALNKRGTTSDHWFDEILWWLEAKKIITQ